MHHTYLMESAKQSTLSVQVPKCLSAEGHLASQALGHSDTWVFEALEALYLADCL